MAQCSLSARELISETYNPRVAVLASPAAQTLCGKNNLKFTQLIHPFSSLTTSLSWLEPAGVQISPRNLRITPVDIASWKPPEHDVQKNRKVLQNTVAQCLPPLYSLDSTETQSDENESGDAGHPGFKLHKLGRAGLSKEYLVNVPASTPWFESWRETFLKLHSEQQGGHHEFMSHFIACILVISSSEAKGSEDLASIIGKLSKLQQQHQTEWPNAWMLQSVLKFYLILHDNENQDLTSAETIYQNLRTMYGGNFCYMLRMNSGKSDSNANNPLIPDPWTYFINQENSYSTDMSGDIYDTSSTLMNVDVTVNTDLLHPLSPRDEFPPLISAENGTIMPASSIFLNDRKPSLIRGQFMTPEDLQNIQVTINEFLGKAALPYVERQTRLLHETIVNRRSMSKSFFGATKRLFGSTKSMGSVVYAADSPEMITRKLADLYFLFGHYSGAYQFYHQLKKDFQADQAWVHYASTLEMAALSHFMMTQAESPLIGARSFPIHYVTEAIRVYIDNCRMTDAAIRCAILCCECLKQMDNYGEAAAVLIRMTSEECDLRSALMLEQAAYAFLQLNSPRKYALHSVLAGHRFAKAGLRTHSLNCYLQALQVYAGRGWRYAEDHVRFTIAMHQYSLQLYAGLAKHMKSLLICPTPQPPSQIESFYKEFLTIMTKLYEEGDTSHELFIPTILSSQIRVRIGNTGLQVGELSESPSSEDLKSSHWDTLEEQVVKECVDNSVIKFKPSKLLFEGGTDNTIHPSVPCNESFYVEIPLENPLSIQLSLQNIGLKFEPGGSVSCTLVNELILEPGQSKLIRFCVQSSKRGRIIYERLFYELKLGSLCVPFEQKLELKGPRLNTSKAERCGKLYAKDLRNEIYVIEQMPLLEAEVEQLPPTLFQTQSVHFKINLRDKSRSCDEWRRITRVIIASENMKDFLEISGADSKALVVEEPTKNYCPVKLNLDGSNPLITVPCVYKAPQQGDVAQLKLLIVYQVSKRTDDSPSHASHSSTRTMWEPLHRAIKISVTIPILPCLRLEYSLLKPVNSRTYLGLLKVQNLTQTGRLELSKIRFHPSKLVIENLTSSACLNEMDPLDTKIVLSPIETHNVVVKSKEDTAIEETSKELDQQLPLYLTVAWAYSSSNETANGIYSLEIRKSLAVSPTGSPKSDEDAPLVFQFHHPARAAQDFNQFSFYSCPVELTITSKWSRRIRLQISRDTEDKSEIIGLSRNGNKASSEEVYFVGQTKWILDIKSLESHRLVYNAAMTRPGIYNIGPLVTVTKYLLEPDPATGQFIEDESTRQTYSLHSPVILAQQSNSLPTDTFRKGSI